MYVNRCNNNADYDVYKKNFKTTNFRLHPTFQTITERILLQSFDGVLMNFRHINKCIFNRISTADGMPSKNP